MRENNIGPFYSLLREESLADHCNTLDSVVDLVQSGAPACELPNQIGLPQVFDNNATVHSNTTAGDYTFDSQWALSTKWWCNRLTVYLVHAYNIRGLPFTDIQLQFRTGIPFACEPYKVSQIVVTPVSNVDSGIILDCSLPPFQAVECWATVLDTNTTIGVGGRLQLRVICRSQGMPVAPDAVYGNMSKQATAPTVGVIGF